MEDLTPHAVVTGASSGVGLAAARALAELGWRVTAVGRTPARLVALEGIPGISVQRCDFSELAQVHDLAQRLKGERIDLLANNAGIVARGSTVDGYDICLQTNHISPFLLTHLLRPQLPPGARIVNTSSMASSYGADPAASLTRVFASGWLAYSTSKKANILFAAEAARRWPEINSYAFHPGVPRTGFGTPLAKFFYRYAPGLPTPESSARQLIWLATAPLGELANGAYYVRYKPARPRGAATSEAAASRLWDATAALLDLGDG